MENSKPLATESFSYSWLTDRKPSSYDNYNLKEHNFHFDVPLVTSHSLVHADEIFSNGQIMPIYVERSKTVETSLNSTSTSSAPSSPAISQLVVDRSANQYYNYSLGRWRKSSRRILDKCFGFVKPLCRRRKGNSKVDDLDRKVFELQKGSNIYSVEVSPRPSFDFYNGIEKVKSWRSSPNISPSRISNACCDAENSINEAILYCKRSNIGN